MKRQLAPTKILPERLKRLCLTNFIVISPWKIIFYFYYRRCTHIKEETWHFLWYVLTCMKINHWISNETICTLLYFIIEVPKTQNRLRNSSRKIYFSSLSLSLEMSLPSFGWNVSCISSLIDIKFLKNTNHWTRISSSLKFE